MPQFRADTVGDFDSEAWKTTQVLNFSDILEKNDYMEGKDYLIYGNLQYLDRNYSLNDSS